jgi:hypothetical protein
MKQFLIALLIFAIPFFGITQDVAFQKITPCSFSIEIPVDMKIKAMYEDSSLDYCDYEVVLKDGFSIMELHSLLNTRFDQSTIDGFYQAALEGTELKVTYKMLGSNFFVISGFNQENGNIVYWKRVLGENYVSDLHIEYNESRKYSIEKYIGRISKSFTSH